MHRLPSMLNHFPVLRPWMCLLTMAIVPLRYQSGSWALWSSDPLEYGKTLASDKLRGSIERSRELFREEMKSIALSAHPSESHSLCPGPSLSTWSLGKLVMGTDKGPSLCEWQHSRFCFHSTHCHLHHFFMSSSFFQLWAISQIPFLVRFQNDLGWNNLKNSPKRIPVVLYLQDLKVRSAHAWLYYSS